MLNSLKGFFRKSFGYGYGGIAGRAINNDINFSLQESSINSLAGAYMEIYPRTAWQLYEVVGELSTAVDLIAEKVAQIKPAIKVGEDYVYEHPLLELLENSGEGRTRERLIRELITDYLLTGEAFPVALGNTGSPPAEILINRSKCLTGTQQERPWPERFQSNDYLAEVNGVFERLNDDGRIVYRRDSLTEMGYLHSKLSSYRSRALSPLKSIQQYLFILMAGSTHNKALLAQGAHPSMLVTAKNADEPLTEDQELQIVDSIRKATSGARNAGKVLFVPSEVSATPMGFNNRDMDYATLQKTSSDKVFYRYGIPLPLANNDAATFNNYDRALLSLYQDKIMPLAEEFFAMLGQFLLPRYGEESAILTFDPESIEVIRKSRIDELNQLPDRDMTTNERRNLIGKESVEGGDVLLAPSGLVEIGQDRFIEDNQEEPTGKSEFIRAMKNHGHDKEVALKIWNGRNV